MKNSKTEFTYNKNIVAKTPRGLQFIIPDCVADDQIGWNQKAFPALKVGSLSVKSRVKLRSDLYGLHGANIIVIRWDK